MNEGIESIGISVTNEIASSLNQYQDSMANDQREFFANTQLLASNETSLPPLLSRILVADVQYPRLNATSLISGLGSALSHTGLFGQDSSASTQILSEFGGQLKAVADVHARVAMALFGTWLAFLVGSSLYYLYRVRKF
jgi:hypothetical protein